MCVSVDEDRGDLKQQGNSTKHMSPGNKSIGLLMVHRIVHVFLIHIVPEEHRCVC